MKKIALPILLLLMFIKPVFSSESDVTYCVDINTEPPTRIFNLAVSAITENTYSLHATHRNKTNDVIGVATGTASLVGNKITMAVNATSTDNSSNAISTYQFDLNVSSYTGTYWSMTQDQWGGLTHNTGEAALISCEEPLTTFYPVSEFDRDGDGYNFITDCDDNNPNIHPGTAEICGDGFDNNCDGNVDENCVIETDPIYMDMDDDGDGFTENQGDCKDNDPNVYPGAEDVCGDDVDQDCSGQDLPCLGFSDNGNGTVTANTGLIWQQSDDDVRRNWYYAVAYCSSLSLGGSSRWQLPTRDELLGLVDERYIPTINNVFIDTELGNYWAEDYFVSHLDNEDMYYRVNFSNGDGYGGMRPTAENYVRCVRR